MHVSQLKDRLRADLTASIKARDEVRSSTLRMVLTSVTNAEVAGKEARELTDEDVLGVLHTANVHSPEDLIKTPIEQIATTTGIDMGDLARLRQRAISWLSEVSS